MPEENQLTNNGYVTSSDAALLYRCSKDYISRLCREGKLKGTLVGRNWFIEKESFENFLGQKDVVKTEALQKLADLRKQEYLEAQQKREISEVKPVEVQKTAEFVSVTGPVVTEYVHIAPVEKPSVAPESSATISGSYVKRASTVSKAMPFAKTATFVLAVTFVFGSYAILQSSYPKEAAMVVSSAARASYAALSGDAPALQKISEISGASYLAASLASLTSERSDFFGKRPDTTSSLFARAYANATKTLAMALGFFAAPSPTDELPLAVFPKSESQTVSQPIAAPAVQNVIAITKTPVQSAPAPVTPVRAIASPDVSRSYVDTQIQILRNSLSSEIFKYSSQMVPGLSQNMVNLAHAQRIDRLTRTTLESSVFNNGTVTGTTFTGGSISGTSISATELSVSGTTSFEGGVTISPGTLTMPYFTANSTATSSTIAYRLGIGTTSPYRELSVGGSGIFGGDLLAGTLTATSTLTVSGLSTFAGLLSTASSTIGAGTQTGGLTIFGGATTTGNAYFAGLVGIGTTTPTTNLSVQGNQYTSGTSFFGGAITATSSLTVSGNTTLVNATTTNLFSTTASSTNLFAQTTSLGTLTVSGATSLSSTLGVSGLSTFAGLLSTASSTIGAGTQTGGLTIFGGATTTGNAYFAGGLGVGIATSTAGVLETSGNAYIGGNLTVIGNSTTLGNSSSNTLTINSSITSSIVPNQNITYDLGSPSFYWRNAYVGTLNANNISAASTTIAGTASATFTLNSDNATSDTEDQDLIFFRGNVVPNALLSWKATTDRFELNQPTFIQNASTDNLTGITLDLKGLTGQTGNLFRIASSTGTDFLNVTSAGLVGIGTTTPTTNLSVQGNQYTSGTAFFGGAITATSTLAISGAITSTATSPNTFPYASSTAFTVSGTGYFGTASTTNLTVSALTSGRVPYITTGGAFSDSANLTFNGTTLTANTLTLSNALTVANGGTGAATFTNNRLLTGNGTSALVDESNLTFDGSLLTITGNASTTQISSTGSAYFATGSGNVGIGTTTPWAKLSVEGTSTLGNQAIAGYFTATSTTASSFAGGFTAFASTTIGAGGQATGLTIFGGATTTGNAYFAGNVGIGTTTSGYSLSVNGTIYTNAGIRFPDGSTQTAAASVANSGTAGQLAYYESAGTTISATSTLFLSTTQKVGVGSTTPWGLLSVNPNGISGPAFVVGSSTKTDFVVTNGGNIGIGTTSPSSKLTVTADGTYNGTVQVVINGTTNPLKQLLLGFDTSSDFGFIQPVTQGTAYRNLILNPSGGNVGIGTTTPFRKLSITEAVATAQVTVAYDDTRYTDFLTSSVGDLTIAPQGQDINSLDSNLWICTGGSCPSGTPTGTGNIIVENKIGIGTTTPAFLLTVNSSNATDNLFQIATTTNQSVFVVNATGRVGVGTSTPTQQFSVADRLFVGAGGASGMGTATSTFQGDIKITGKLDVGTIDPVYTIDGVKYATYGHSTIGVKEEAVQVVELSDLNTKTGYYEKKIAFKDLREGEDLWLFYQITDFGRDWKSLVINLTASFDGKVFYTKVPNEAAVIISASAAGEVSARFIANRFDSDKWPNVRPDQDDTYKGHEIETTEGQGKATKSEQNLTRTNPEVQILNSAAF